MTYFKMTEGKAYRWSTKSEHAWTVMASIEHVCGADWMELISNCKEEPLASIRQICVNSMAGLGMSHREIAKYLHRDRSTITVSVSGHMDRLEADRDYAKNWNDVQADLLA